jgi:hypothetical protein
LNNSDGRFTLGRAILTEESIDDGFHHGGRHRYRYCCRQSGAYGSLQERTGRRHQMPDQIRGQEKLQGER